jgi:UDP-N-acetylglucosamine 2-epimerase (non-hydrolysing)
LTRPPTVLAVFGTRPEAIKLAPILQALPAHSLVAKVVVTGQHKELLRQVLDVFAIGVDEDLDLMVPGQALGRLTASAIDRLSESVRRFSPDAIVVQGDTTSTFAGAIAGFYAQVPVVHAEAGLRTGSAYDPFPEEMNRRLTTQLASLHLAPTRLARMHLVNSGIQPSAIVITGNTVIDALKEVLARTVIDPSAAAWHVWSSHPGPVVLVTVHRRESWGPPLVSIARAIRGIAHAEPDALIVIPLHPNPVVRRIVEPGVEGLSNVRVIEPLDYPDFVALLNRSTIVLTDSGGVQEEAPSLGKPVIVLRNTTERQEALDLGFATLVGTNEDAIVRATLDGLRQARTTPVRDWPPSPFGDGHAGDRSAQAIAHLLGTAARPADFAPNIAG